MALNASTKMNPGDVFGEPYLQILKAIVELKSRQLGEHKTFAEIAKGGERLLATLQGEEKGLSILILTFSLLGAIEAWPSVRKALESQETQIWRPN